MRLAILTLSLLPGLAFAAGSESSDAPTPTETVEQCTEGLVFDIATQTCMTPEASTNDDSAMMNDIRSLSHVGRYADALVLLAAMPDQSDPLVLTYYGFVTRKSGDLDAGLAFYAQALTIDPDNMLARSYRGQAYVDQGRMDLAMADLTQIRMAGGRGTWAETSLATAIATGQTYTH